MSKKIMFSDAFGLTKAVLDGNKTMTRRLVGKRMTEYDIIAYLEGYKDSANICAQYKIGEIVAVAQSYKDIADGKSWINGERMGIAVKHSMTLPGWNNKMFVKADLMPHQIRITDIKVERLQDISDEDCLKEGIFIAHPIDFYYRYGFTHSGSNYHTPREAFAALIDKVSGKGTWKRNPFVFAYTFELVK